MPGNPWEYEPVEDYRKREAAQLAPETPTTPARAAAPSYDPYSPFRTSTGKVTPLSAVFGALQAPTEYVGVPLLGAITAGLQPGRQVYTTPGADPWQQMGEAYQQWRRIEHEREPLFWGEKFITENIIFDPLTWVTMGGLKALGKSQAVLMNALKAAGVKDDAITLAVKASQSVDDVSRIPTALLHLAQSSGIDATDAAKIYKLGKTLRAVDIASSPLEWAGLGSRALGQATSPAARYASKALGAVDWIVTLPFRAAKGAVKAGGEALERAVHPQRLYAVAGELPGLEEIAKTGKTFAFGPTGDEPYELKLKLVELDELVPSHTLGLEANPKFPAELQPRLRGRAASKGQIAEIAQELDPSRLLIDTHQLDTGPMIVGTDNVVESGNARVLALMKARQDVPENWRRYVNELKDIAARYGIDPGQVDAMKAPVLVRQRLTDVDRASFVRAANLGSVLQMSPVEYALEDERALPRNAIELLFAQEGENIEASLQRAQNRPLVEGWLKNLPTEERAALVTSEGTINQLGMQRLKNSLLRRAFPGETGTRIIEAFAESTDLNIKRLESGIYSSLAWLSQLETRVGAGTIDPKYSIGEDLAAAIDRFVRLKREGMSVADYLAQAQMFGRELTPDQEQLLGILDEIATNSRKVREFILSYTDAALKTKAPAQGAMFAGELPERSLLLENARKAIGAPGEEFAGEGLWARRAPEEPIEGVAERGLVAGQPPTPKVPVERIAPEISPAPSPTEAVPPALPEIPVEARPEVGAAERAAVGEVTPAMRPGVAPETPPAALPQLPSGPQPIALLPDGSEMPLNQVPEGEIPRAILPPAEPVTGYQQRLPLGAGGRGGGGGGNDLTYLRDALSARPPEPEGDPLEAAFSRFKEQFYDRLESLKLLEKETGIRAYTLARLVPGSGMAGESYIREFVQPVLRSVGDDIHGLEEYMVLMRSRDLLEINPEAVLPGGMKDPAKAIAQLAEELGPERFGTIERAAEQLWELNDRYILQPLRDEGLISGEAYTAIRGRWPHYIPFYREGFDWPSFTLPTGASKRTGGPANVGEQIIRAISEEGSALPLDEPLARWQAQFIQTQERISRNKAARALIDALESVDPSLVARGATEATGTKGIVNWYEAGKKLSARVPKQYEIAAKALGAESADATTRMLRAMTQPLRVGATQVNPAFMVSNIIRDSMDAWTREGLRPFSQDWLAGVTSAFVHGEEWHEAARAGVLGVGFVERARTTEALKATHRLGEIKLDSIGDALLLIPRLIMQANEIIEQGTRVATFKKLRGEGIEQLEAALRARDVTVDFAKSGNFIKLLNQMIPFLNAGIQGSVNTAKQVATKPVQAIVRSLPLMMVSTLAYLWNQRFETAKDIPDYVYSDHWVIQIGEGIRHPDPKYPDAEPERFPIYIRLPKGPAASFLTAPAELAMRLAFGRNDRSVVEEILAAGSSTFRAVSPVELSSLTTPGLGTVTQLAANYDIFRQRQIVPEWEMGRPPEERYDVQTSDTAVALGRAFNVSPRIIDFAINDMTGGGGRAAVWLLDLGLGALGYEAPVAAGEARRRPATTAEELVRTPVVGRFLGASGTGAKLVQYERLDKALSAARRTLYKNEEFRRFGLGVNPPGESVTINGVPQQLPPDVRVRIVEMATPLMREALDQLAATDFYAQMDDIQRKKALDHIRGKVQDSVRDYLTGQGGQPITPQEIPYLIEAYRQYLEYESIPTYWGMSEQESELASRAMSQISALRRANPTLPYNVTVQIYAQQDPMGAYLAQIARQRTNPMRQQYWASHPLLSRYYSSADPSLLQTVLMPQTAGYQVPSWAPSGSAEGATPGYAGVAGT